MFTLKAAVKCFIEEDGKILLMKEASNSSWRPGAWGLPGGKIDPEESFIDTLKRELKEETGLKVQIQGLLRIDEIIAKDKNGDRLVHHFIFSGKKIGGKLKDQDHHVAELKWLTKQEVLKIPLISLTEYYYKDLFKDYFKNKNKLIPLFKIKIWNANKSKAFDNWLKYKIINWRFNDLNH